MFRSRYRYIFVALLGVYSYLNILFTGGDRLFESATASWQFLIMILITVLLVWESNRGLFQFFEHQDSSLSRKLTPLVPFFLASLVSTVLIAAVATYAVAYFWSVSLAEYGDQLKLTLAFVFRINLFLHTINAIVYFNSKLKNTMVEAERLKTISVESQFEALRNQINPHFLFNSLNVLSEVVHQDADLASNFIKQLANVYRYLLYNQENKTVSLKTEMEFIEAFVFLLKIRFDDQVIVNNDTATVDQEVFQLPPASVQLLVENAIKHNVTSRKRPLQINIFTEGDYLVVQNVIQRKANQAAGGVGLNNIRMRYQHLVNKEVEVREEGGVFVVKLPMIKHIAVDASSVQNP